MKMNWKLWILLGLVVFFVVQEQNKKSALETIQIQDIFTSQLVLFETGNNGVVLASTPITLTPYAQQKVLDFNSQLSRQNIPYSIPTSINNCDDLILQTDSLISTIKSFGLAKLTAYNNQLQITSSARLTKLTNNINTNILNKFYLAQQPSGNKKGLTVMIPTKADAQAFCNQFNIDFPASESYANIEKCGCFNGLDLVSPCTPNQCFTDEKGIVICAVDSCPGNRISVSELELFSSLRQICTNLNSYSERYANGEFGIYGVCSGDQIIATSSKTSYNSLMTYASTGTFDSYRSWILNNAGTSQIVSTKAIGLCRTTADCSIESQVYGSMKMAEANLTCSANKCVSSNPPTGCSPACNSTQSCVNNACVDNGGIENKWYENTTIWLIIGGAIFLLVIILSMR